MQRNIQGQSYSTCNQHDIKQLKSHEECPISTNLWNLGIGDGPDDND